MKDYPTEEELEEIEDRKIATYEEAVALAEYIVRLWHFDDWATLKGKRVKILRLATGGWSGNEDIVSALKRNFFFMSYWESSHRGGLHIFKIKK